MTARPLNDIAAASAALVAFLRGVERRGAVFAQLQVGDADAGDAALAGAMTAFREAAPRTPFGDWPSRFWSLLLASPHLRSPPPQPRWPAGFEALGRVGSGPRAALLLRLVANVSEADAAAVLGVARPTYRVALQRALPRRDDGDADEAAWRQLGEQVQHMLRRIAPERLAELARLREAVVQGQACPPEAWRSAPAAPDRGRPRWLWPTTIAVAAATLAALAASFVLPPGVVGDEAGPRQIRVEPLPPAQAPAATYGADLALLAHPDFELLTAEGDNAAMRDPAFHAWLAVQLGRDGDTGIVHPQREEAGADADETSLESEDAP